MIKKCMLYASLTSVLVGCSNFSYWSKRDVASTQDTPFVKVFRHQDSTLEFSEELAGLSFGSDKEKAESMKKILAFIEEHKKEIVAPEAGTLTFVPEVKASPEGLFQFPGKIYADSKSISIRFQQASAIVKNGKKLFVPYEGAELVAIVRDGKLDSLNSSLLVPFEGSDEKKKAEEASIDDFKSSSTLDRASLFRSFLIHKDENDQKSAFATLFPSVNSTDKKTWLSKFTQDGNLLFRVMQKLQEKDGERIKLVYAKASSGSKYELTWKLNSPFGLPVHIFFSADKMKANKFIKSYSLLTDVEVAIYRGFLLKPDLLKVKSGDSAKWAVHSANEDTGDDKEALINLSKVVEYNKKRFNWNSYDNKGSTVKATVKLGGDMLSQNAAWIGSPYNQFVFGKGGEVLSNFTGALDVIGHEYFHSIVGNTAALDHSGQQGGLNEHLADIFGVGFESEVALRPYDFKIGEGVIVKNQGLQNPIGLRDFLHPDQGFSEQLTTMAEINKYFGDDCVPDEKNDRCGVHYVNGLPNLAVGRFIQEQGWVKVRDMIFQVVSKRLRTSSDFMDYKNQLVEECKVTPQMTTKDCQTLDKNFADLGLSSEPNKTEKTPETDICAIIKDTCKMLKDNGYGTLDSCKKCGL